MSFLHRYTLVLGVGLTIAGCRTSGISSGQCPKLNAAGGTNNAGPSLMLDLNWDDQLRGTQNPEIDPSLLVRVHARVVRRSFPTFDVGSVGGPDDRWAIFRVIDDEVIPQYPKVRRIFLSTTLARLVSQFLPDDEVYTLLFTRDMRLYDVVDSHGRSPVLRATNDEP